MKKPKDIYRLQAKKAELELRTLQLENSIRNDLASIRSKTAISGTDADLLKQILTKAISLGTSFMIDRVVGRAGGRLLSKVLSATSAALSK
jgi:hypothetical protein